tara:strand:+ start:4326 stop:4592 length:267 start_codon:yes stop_codon:yes gene_type:complete
MIFRIHIQKDSEQINLARKIRALLDRANVYSSTYEPKDAEIGIKLHKVPSKKLLGQIFGLVQRGGYEIEQISPANAKAIYQVSLPQRE